MSPLPARHSSALLRHCLPTSMASVRIENISKTFAGNKGASVAAVDGLSLEANEREFLVIIGPSGCGKTTTLRLIAGLESPDCGTIRINGVALNGTPAKDRDVAMVF